MSLGTRDKINPRRAMELRAKTTMTWPQIAYVLSLEVKRVPPFRGDSVCHAVRQFYGGLAVPDNWRQM